MKITLTKYLTKKRLVLIGVFILLSIWYLNCLPSTLFNDPVSLVVRSSNGDLLGGRIANDGQWRFPHNDSVPEKFSKAITTFEDKRFFSHIGIDFLAIGRAVKQNFRNDKVVSGGSTITMQTIRLSRKGQSRTYWEKIKEVFLATRLEIKHSKRKILSYYSSNAPFGGNVVGLDAASWKYYGREARELTWAETATLAVLPNAPSIIQPSKNRNLLKEKRNKLLKKLLEQNHISEEEYELSLLEPLPSKPKPLPNITPHLTDEFLKQTKGIKTSKRITTTINSNLQKRVNKLLNRHSLKLQQNGVFNAGAVVLDVQTNNILAYVGNSSSKTNERNNAVNMIPAKRSTGSILKPFLYALCLEEGQILPRSLVEDIPSFYSGFSPKNYDKSYHGVVPASEALSRSLNVPMVQMLQEYGHQKFHSKMKKLGMTTLTETADHYGLSLILGGAETNLLDLSTLYSGLSRTVNDFAVNGKYRKHCFESPRFILDTNYKAERVLEHQELSASSAFFTLEAMKEVQRPGVMASWKQFASSQKIAWKTGTSFGNRDAWAVGCTKNYVVAIWVGNSDGEGRPDMTGTRSAAPLLFSIFGLLDTKNEWFSKPIYDLTKVDVCKNSGYLATENCPRVYETKVGKPGVEGKSCMHCTLINLNKERNKRVRDNCYPALEIESTKLFVLPPTEEHYYIKNHPQYVKLPEWLEGCESSENSKTMSIAYPKISSNLFIPITLNGNKGKVVFEVQHKIEKSLVYWHLDESFLGTTRGIHEMELTPAPGKHILVLVDENGQRLTQQFNVIK